MWHKMLICLLSIFLPLQVSTSNLLSFKSAFASGDEHHEENQQQTYNGNSQGAGTAIKKSALLNDTPILKDVPAPVKDQLEKLNFATQGNVIITERWMSFAVMLMIAVGGFFAISSCQGFSIDVLLFGAGALIYLAGEAITTFMYQGINNRSIDVTRDRQGKLKTDQMDYLKDQKKSYEDAIKVIRIKMMFQLAAAATFYAAAIVSTIQAFQQIGSFMACLGSAAKSVTLLASTCPGTGQSECQTKCESGQAANIAPGAGVAATAVCIAECTAAVTVECEKCAAVIGKFMGLLAINQGQLLLAKTTTENVPIKAAMKEELDQMVAGCLDTVHPECVTIAAAKAAQAAAAIDTAKNKAMAATELALSKVLAMSPMAPPTGSATTSTTSSTTRAAAPAAAEGSNKGAGAAGSSATNSGGHAQAYALDTKTICEASNFFTWKDLYQCPTGMIFARNNFTPTPKYVMQQNPWFRFLLDEAWAESPLSGYDPTKIGDGSKSADKTENTIALALGFPFIGLGIVAGLLAKFLWPSFFNQYMGLPFVRGIAYGIIGSASMTTAGLSFVTEQTLQENIRVIDSILNPKASMAGNISTPGVTRTPWSNINLMAELEDTNQLPLTQKNSFPCLHGDGKGNCLETTGQMQAGLSVLGLDAETLRAAGLASKATDGLSGQKNADGKTLGTVNTLASAARGMRKRAHELRALLNRKLGEARQQPIDFEGHEKRFSDNLQQAIKQMAPKESAQIASFMDQMKNLVPPEEVLKKSIKSTEAAYGELISKTTLPAGVNTSQLDDLLKANYEYQGETQDQELARLAAEQKFDLPKNDIVQENSENLFKMITIRYFKSAYPVFFKEEK
ncbi:MAG: hypothetical protein HYV97_10350 [Bdellovibrio sp.]|nr:hypothetical protein [Bdellovibrio sp.]